MMINNNAVKIIKYILDSVFEDVDSDDVFCVSSDDHAGGFVSYYDFFS